MHPNDRREMLVTGHPGSKQHMGGRKNGQKRRDLAVRRRQTVAARSATVQAKLARLRETLASTTITGGK